MSGLRRFLGIFLAAALLVAQQAAIEHALWHAGAAGAQSKQSGPERTPLCGQHDALGTVAGAIGCAATPVAAEAPASVPFAAIAASPASLASIVPLSRGPPAFL